MPDDTLISLRVDVNTAPIGQIRDALKEVRLEIEGLAKTDPEYKLRIQEAQVYSKALKSVNFDINGMSAMVRQNRAENRMFRFVLLEVMGGLQGVGNALDLVTGKTGESATSFKNLTNVLGQSLAAGSGASFMLQMLGGSFAKLAGPVGIVLGVLTLMAGVIKGIGDEAKKAKPKIEDAFSRLKELLPHRADFAELIRRAELRGEITPIQATELRLMVAREAAKERVKTRKEIEKVEKEADDKELAFAKAELAQREKRWEIERRQRELARISPEYRAAAAMFGGPAVPLIPGAAMTRLRGAGVGGVSPEFVSGVKQTSLEMKLIQKEVGTANTLVNTMTDSMATGFQEATAYLAEGFQKAFGLGNSLLDRMISTFATSALMALPGAIASLMTAGATGNIFTAIFASFQGGGRLPENIVGVGSSGRGYMLHKDEYVSPVNRIGQEGRYGGGQSFQPYITVVPITDNKGLAVRVEVGNRLNRKKRI